MARPRDPFRVIVLATDRARRLGKKTHDFHRSAARMNVQGKSTSPKSPLMDYKALRFTNQQADSSHTRSPLF